MLEEEFSQRVQEMVAAHQKREKAEKTRKAKKGSTDSSTLAWLLKVVRELCKEMSILLWYVDVDVKDAGTDPKE